MNLKKLFTSLALPLLFSLGSQASAQLSQIRAEANPGEESLELLEDQFFYEFDETGKPRHWETSGKSRKIEGGFNASTGFSVGINTGDGKTGYISQSIDLNRTDKQVNPGDMLEGLIHYRSQAPRNPAGAFRLACHWLDKEGKQLSSGEDAFINAPGNWFDKHKAWGTIRFRTIAPEGAARFVFRVETNAHTETEFDDFSLLRLIPLDRDRQFISILPEVATVEAKVGQPSTGKMLVQGMGLLSTHEAYVDYPNGEMSLSLPKLPQGNSINEISYTITPEKKGAYPLGKTSIQYPNVDPIARLNIQLYAIEPNNPPQVKLKSMASIPPFRAFPGQSDAKELSFDISGEIASVNLAIEQAEGGPFRLNSAQFFYSEKQGKVLNNSVKLSFAPQKPGKYTANLRLSTAMMDTVRYELSAECLAWGDTWIETFETDKKLDPRFVGEAWKNYHLFDRSYYRLDGRWKAANTIELDPNGLLECDETFVNGIASIRLQPHSSSVYELEISLDGGGHWQKIGQQGEAFVPATNRPTRFRIRNTSEEKSLLNRIEVIEGDKALRTVFDKIENCMLQPNEEQPVELLSEKFESLRHTRPFNLSGWQSLIFKGNRPFWGWDQKNFTSGETEERCAQISFYRLGEIIEQEHESWLISPAISFQKAKSKILTFRLRFSLPPKNLEEKFGMYIITKQSGKLTAQYLDITKHLLVKDLDRDSWYDYFIDLSQDNSIQVEDLFYLGFSLHSPEAGNAATLAFMIDDVTFGRTDHTTIKTDKDLLLFQFIPDIKTAPQSVSVTVENPRNPISVSVEPRQAARYFAVDKTSIPAEGAEIQTVFKAKEKTDRAAALLLQTRGGSSALVKLLATLDSGVEIPSSDNEITVYPTITTDLLHIKGNYSHFYLFAMDGRLLSQGGYTHSLDVSSLPAGRYLMMFVTAEGSSTNSSFVKE
ncbi:hypothetical protein HQ45_07265 [Porphyromonas crevioricanis]|uniref:choice-of-anchor J domain-containing protein n=1 Tax=Porphyromonas crevioricanis TaxID=393921 RepID=UPI00052DD1C3|nr:choice-of-anchor J domain-containing protein [Porphyromonas crevioricanis]KGN89329.1 hypothetical protein HQ45_07265 [Porphyromonas crevioricanis]